MAGRTKRDGLELPPAVGDMNAYDRIRGALLSGVFPPGQPLVEVSLAEWCGVSRTPIREALFRLAQDGLIVRGERGYYVRERSPEEIFDIYEARMILEPAIARSAAQRRNAVDLLRMEKWVTGDVDPEDDQAMVRVNRALHEAIWKASHNDALIDLVSRINLHLNRYPATTLAYPGRWAEAVAEHRLIVEAIAAGDGELAAERAAAHFLAARDIRLSMWERDEV